MGTLIASLAINSWFGPLYIRYRSKGKVKLDTQPIITHALAIVLPCVVLALVVALYYPTGWVWFTGGVAIVALYLVLSWRVMSLSSRELIRSSIRGLWALPFSAKRTGETTSSQALGENPEERDTARGESN